MEDQKTLILDTLSTIVPFRECIELRIQKKNTYWGSGFYDNSHLQRIANDAIMMESDSKGIYITLNTTNPDLLARRKNRFENGKLDKNSLTKDEDITNWDYLPIDVDPVRISGVSSTNEELELALEVANKVKAYMASIGFCAPVMACSGNGYHLLYRIDFPRGKENDVIVKNCLYALASMFDTDKAGVDIANNNPSRIFKLYGTWAKKGDNLPERPWRLSRIIEIPENFDISPPEIVLKLAASKTTQSGRIDLKKAKSELKDPSKVIQRHPELLKLVGKLIRNKLTYPAILAACVETNAQFPEPKPADVLEREVKQMYDDITQKEADKAEKSIDSINQPTITEVAVAENFVESLNGNCIFNISTKKWHVWTGKAWQVDKRNHVYEKARSFVKTLYAAAGDLEPSEVGSYIHDVKKMNTRNGVSNIVALAGIQLTKVSEDFDSDPHLLNMQNGTLVFTDEGIKFREHCKEDMCSFVCNCNYDPDAPVPELWTKHIRTVTCEDDALAANLQEILGYVLDGGNPYELFLILHGPGRNGKSVTTRVFQHILGDYAITVNPLTLMENGNKTISPERIQMLNKRFIVAQEPNKHDDQHNRADLATIDAGFIKNASGRDFINARELYSNDIKKFKVSGLITFSTNPLPKITDNSVAFWARLIAIPFRYILPEWEQDDKLEMKLQKVAPGILNWSLEGLTRAKQGRLKLCPAIKEDIANYRLTVDEYALFCDKCIREAFDSRLTGRELYSAYVDYQKSVGASLQNETVFGIEMGKRYNKVRTENGIIYKGIKIYDQQATVV